MKIRTGMISHNIVFAMATASLLLVCAVADAESLVATLTPNDVLAQIDALSYSESVPSAFTPKMFLGKAHDRVDTRLQCQGCGYCQHPTAVSAPCATKGGWSVGYTSFMQEASTSVQTFAQRKVIELNESNQSEVVQGYLDVQPNFSYAFEMDGRYDFGAGRDLSISYEHGNQLYRGAIGTFVGSVTFQPSIVSGFILPVYQVVNANDDFLYNTVNVEMGQHVDVGTFGALRVHAGLEYAQIDYIKNIYGVGTSSNPDQSVAMRSEYEGVGPGMGLDLTHYIGSGFSMLLRSNFGLLIGDNDVDATQSNVGVGVVQSYSFEREHIVVPTLELRAGARVATSVYSYGLIFEGGYRFADYYKSLQFVRGAGAVTESFNVQGAYLTARLEGDF